MTARCGISGCWDRDEVEVCWESFIAVRATALRYGPSFAAPLRPNGGLDAGNGVCLQSTRNPSCIVDPPLRPSENGFVWGYKRAGSFAGWVPAGDLAADTSAPPCCGPAGADFPCGIDFVDSNCRRACGGDLTGDVGSRSGRRTVTAQDLTMRYAPQSTQFRWLLNGDVVELRCFAGGYFCVEAVNCDWVPTGTRGWAIATAF